MQQNSNNVINNIKFLFPQNNNLDSLINHKSFVPFEKKICDFLNEVSKVILKDTEAKQYPDVITFGFFCRKANIEQIKKTYEGRLNGRLGRGLTFHIAPSNVPINFAYTLISGLLSGNRCIVRASSKDFPQTRLLCRIFNSITEQKEFELLKDIFAVIMYEHSQEITEALSKLADIRIIWGGDNTISEIRKSPLKPRAFDITFADRYSFAIFDADYVLRQNESEMKKIAQDFYNDTYLYDQNACSSPRLIIWLGNEEQITNAKEKFWNAVYENISTKYSLAPILAVDKLSASYKTAIELKDIKVEKVKDNIITRILLPDLPVNITEYTCAGGCYLEYNTESVEDLTAIVNKKFQTFSYLGIDPERIKKFVIDNGLSGIDRIVPVGKTADFSFVWDGYDLILTRSRIIEIR